mmetsp:Transcript_11754/g.25858  ORF Transcript_11754/g.25858 Transcript_11754/m.25858 type:complete len:209 (+) Transcript_11754:431-1057(+)
MGVNCTLTCAAGESEEGVDTVCNPCGNGIKGGRCRVGPVVRGIQGMRIVCNQQQLLGLTLDQRKKSLDVLQPTITELVLESLLLLRQDGRSDGPVVLSLVQMIRSHAAKLHVVGWSPTADCHRVGQREGLLRLSHLRQALFLRGRGKAAEGESLHETAADSPRKGTTRVATGVTGTDGKPVVDHLLILRVEGVSRVVRRHLKQDHVLQ